MLAVASNLFGKSSSLSAYTLHTPSASPAASSSNLPSTSSSSGRTFNVGLWKVVSATHKTTNKDVSVWIFEKRVLDGIKNDSSGRGAVAAKEWVIEQLKKEVSRASSGLMYHRRMLLKGRRLLDSLVCGTQIYSIWLNHSRKPELN